MRGSASLMASSQTYLFLMSQPGTGRAAQVGMILGPALFLTIVFSPTPTGMSPEAQRLLAVTALMSSWWLTQAIPIAATSLLPIVLFPLLGIQTSAAVSNAYINKQVFLFLGGFIIALGIEKWGLHERIALHIVRVLGTSLRKVILGFMLATGFLSMWISNTASTLLMTPIGLALVLSLEKAIRAQPGAAHPVGYSHEEQHGLIDRDGPLGAFGISLMLGIAWSASIGGLTTLVGTVTNVQFVSLWEAEFPAGPKISAAAWLTAFGPVGLGLILLAWGLLTWNLKGASSKAVDRQFFSERLRKLGRPSFAEVSMLVVFAATALLWTFRKPLKFGEEALIGGWGDLVNSFLIDTLHATPEFAKQAVDDSTVAIAMAVLLFLLPSGRLNARESSRLMDWETAQTLPWAILLLVGGGFAIADSFDQTGLASWVGDAFASQVADWPIWATIGAVCLLLTFLTEFATNVVVVSVILPVLAKASVELQIDPRLLMLPAAASASCAFMLPIGTPPNAIVFSSRVLSMGDMAKKGFLLNLIGVVLMTIATVVYLVPNLDLQTDGLPEWAGKAATGNTQ
ncbi:SLC13/DASS family transporter [bacterium]|nr:SLC13/DASS family transporter [bacterium]